MKAVVFRLKGGIRMSVKMPKPVSKTELSRLYTRLAIDTHHRLDNSTAEGQARLGLLHRFFDACANLYGTMTLWHAWELFSMLSRN